VWLEVCLGSEFGSKVKSCKLSAMTAF